MRKISLNVDALTVESFEATAANAEKSGTVHARGFTRYWEQSCYQSCTNIADCLCLSELGQCG
ncbi:hypothetical protein [Longimicrobium sp.]|uniref:hypothetical protein n=1 Tax=Longimicrobium sp. TaxID=2029185 RepID=UPI002CB29726|nr:hypothetical protein [Longimicrobium sp.]HSU13275.1 hypothetical protein [Longimicrobium sp.]